MSHSRLFTRALVGLALLAPLGAVSTAQSQEVERNAFNYNASLSAGRTVNVRNVNGAISVERSRSNQVEITAEKRWRRGDPDDVRIVQVAGRNGDIMVCALWNDAECTENGIRSQRRQTWNDRNDVSVHFTVRVPDGVHVNMSTVNGGVTVDAIAGMIDASTVNGSVEARSTGGPVHAKTVNGSIKATMASLGSENLEYETVNGSITLTLPANSNVDLDISTVNGSVNTDFPVTVQGSISRRKLRGSIGSGGRSLKASTVNGSVNLVRGGER
jgi:DUF4097 and DUF4098 domain-containing protein YvlB